MLGLAANIGHVLTDVIPDHVISVNISGNDLTSEGAHCLAAALMTNRTISVLDVSDCDLSGLGLDGELIEDDLSDDQRDCRYLFRRAWTCSHGDR